MGTVVSQSINNRNTRHTHYIQGRISGIFRISNRLGERKERDELLSESSRSDDNRGTIGGRRRGEGEGATCVLYGRQKEIAYTNRTIE